MQNKTRTFESSNCIAGSTTLKYTCAHTDTTATQDYSSCRFKATALRGMRWAGQSVWAGAWDVWLGVNWASTSLIVAMVCCFTSASSKPCDSTSDAHLSYQSMLPRACARLCQRSSIMLRTCMACRSPVAFASRCCCSARSSVSRSTCRCFSASSTRNFA